LKAEEFLSEMPDGWPIIEEELLTGLICFLFRFPLVPLYTSRKD
jgi:hypothetical protein